jgi:hypothetical protein
MRAPIATEELLRRDLAGKQLLNFSRGKLYGLRHEIPSVSNDINGVPLMRLGMGDKVECVVRGSRRGGQVREPPVDKRQELVGLKGLGGPWIGIKFAGNAKLLDKASENVLLHRRELQNHNKADRGILPEKLFDHVPQTERYRGRLDALQERTVPVAKENAGRVGAAEFFELPGFAFQRGVDRIAG